MNYRVHYDQLINRAKVRKLTVYGEKHHIVPVCMGGINDSTNIVKLTPEEHFIAHQFLVKMYPDHAGLIHAAHMMGTTRSSNKSYGWLRRLHAAETSKESKARWENDNYRKRCLERILTINNDPSVKQQRSTALKARWSDPLTRAELLNRPSQEGRVFTDEHRKNLSAGCIGRVPANKGIKTNRPAPNRGVAASEEVRSKMRESAKLRWDKHRASKVLNG